MLQGSLNRLRKRPAGLPLSYWQLAALSSAVAATGAAFGGSLWRLVAGTSDNSSPDRLAATAAVSVAEAARQHIIDTVDDQEEDPSAAIHQAAVTVIDEAASAGADVVAAAFGALQGAQQSSRTNGQNPGVVQATIDGLREASDRVGPAARERIDALIRQLGGP